MLQLLIRSSVQNFEAICGKTDDATVGQFQVDNPHLNPNAQGGGYGDLTRFTSVEVIVLFQMNLSDVWQPMLKRQNELISLCDDQANARIRHVSDTQKGQVCFRRSK